MEEEKVRKKGKRRLGREKDRGREREYKMIYSKPTEGAVPKGQDFLLWGPKITVSVP